MFFSVSVHWSLESIFLDCHLRSSPWAKPWLTCWAACMAQSRNGDTKPWCRGVVVSLLSLQRTWELEMRSSSSFNCSVLESLWLGSDDMMCHVWICLDMFGSFSKSQAVLSKGLDLGWTASERLWLGIRLGCSASLVLFAHGRVYSLCWTQQDFLLLPGISLFIATNICHFGNRIGRGWQKILLSHGNSKILSWQFGNWEVKRCKNFRRDDLLEGVQPNHYEHRMGTLNLKCQSTGASSPRLHHVLPVFLLCKAKALSLRAPWSPFSTCWYPGWSGSITRV